MTKREWFIVIGALVAAWFVDQVSKQFIVEMQRSVSWGPVLFALTRNPGAMMGLFSNLPSFLRIVSLSTVGAILVCVYVLLQYLLPLKSLTLRVGMSFLMGGIIGNVTDRIVWGYVVDFFIFHWGNFYSPAFNLADAIQWVGYAAILYALIRDGDILWPEYDARRVYWINFKFQMKYSLVLFAVGCTLALITFVFSYTFLKVSLQEVMGPVPNANLSRYLYPYAITFTLIVIGFSVVLFTLGKIISHRIAGPLFAFERYMRDSLDNPSPDTAPKKFKLRQYDEFKSLEKLAEDIRTRIKNPTP